jgi:DHA1 family inner membrane transport protein
VRPASSAGSHAQCWSRARAAYRQSRFRGPTRELDDSGRIGRTTRAYFLASRRVSTIVLKVAAFLEIIPELAAAATGRPEVPMAPTRVLRSAQPPEPSPSRVKLLRWQAGYGTFGIPQAAAPITFSLVALPLTGTAESGAAMVSVMTVAQVLCAVPVSRAGRRFESVQYLRVLLGVRTTAFAVVTVLAAVGAPFVLLLIAVAVAGSVNGAAQVYQRLLLNLLVEPRKLPRALGVAATLNEVTFAISPAIASALGAASPVAAMILVTALGAGPMVLMPRVTDARGMPHPAGAAERLPAPALVWLFCAAASAGAVGAVQVGAVSIALSFGLAPAWGFLFASAMCAGSVMGGIWVSVRNRMPSPWRVVVLLVMTIAGMGAVLVSRHVALTLAGVAVIGYFLPMLGTFYSLALDELAPPRRRADVFALYRTASSLGIITVSGALALFGLPAALFGSFAALLVGCGVVVWHAVSS